MVEIPGNEIPLRKKAAQQKIESDRNIKNAMRQTKSAQTAVKTGTSEQIEFSSKARNIHQAQEVLKTTPEIRAEKVARIKKEISEGRFKVDSNVLAEKILEEIIQESNFLK